MKRILTVIVLSLLAMASLYAHEKNYDRYEIVVDNMTREYKMFIPEGIQEDAPLLVMFHGYGGHSGDCYATSDFVELAKKYGFAICMPQGSEDPDGVPSWNVFYYQQKGMKADDLHFISELVPAVQKKFHLSKKNTFCIGTSNGGDLCYYLAHANSKLFTAIGSIVGVLMVDIRNQYDYSKCSVPFIEFHGTADSISYWNGNMTDSINCGFWYPVPEAVGYMAANAGCKKSETCKLPHKGGKEVIFHRYYDGDKSKKKGVAKEVWFYEVTGGDHWWQSDDMSIADETVKFFSKYIR